MLFLALTMNITSNITKMVDVQEDSSRLLFKLFMG